MSNNEAFLRQVGEKPFSAEETKAIINHMLAGRFSEAQTMAYLTGSAERRPTVPEIVGGAEAMRSQMRTITAPRDAMDLCGTGGDGLGTLNISTAVSFVVAAAGVPVPKHGNRSRSSKSGAADVLESMGVRIDLEPEEAERVLAKVGLVFLFAPAYHPAMRHVDRARREIGQRTIFNLLGPLTNPAGVKRQLTGVFGHEWLMPYAETLQALGAEHAMVVHGKGVVGRTHHHRYHLCGDRGGWQGSGPRRSCRRMPASNAPAWKTSRAARRTKMPRRSRPCWRARPGLTAISWS